MELTFNKVDNWYEAEFEIADDINLHIELNVAAPIKLYQKTSGDKYDLVQAFKPSMDKVLDVDLMALVYPKWIKVVSQAEVTRAVVLPEGVAKQTGGVKSEYDISKQEDMKALYGLLESLQKDSSGKVQNLPEFNVANWYEGSGSIKVRNAWLEYEGKYLISTEMGEFNLRSEDGEYWVDIDA